MVLSSRLGRSGFFTLALVGFVLASTGCSGCSDDDTTPAPSDGKGGAGGASGGASGSAGSAGGGDAGSAGAAGAAGGAAGTGGATGGSAGTGGAGGNVGCGPATGDGTLATVTALPIGDARVPFDATPSPDGCSVFFTALDAVGTPGVYKTSTGGAASLVGTSPLLQIPSGIAINSSGGTLYVADPEAETIPQVHGAVFTLPTGGGGAEVLSGTAGKSVSGVTVARLAGVDVVYFTGREPDGRGAVYSIPPAGGTATPIFVGTPLVQPSGVAVATDGTVYVTDRRSDSGQLATYALKGNTATFLRGGFRGGFPAGVALSTDGVGLLVGSQASGVSASAIHRIDLADTSETDFTTGLTAGNDPAGLHRALSAEVYALVDQGVGAAGGVYLLTP